MSPNSEGFDTAVIENVLQNREAAFWDVKGGLYRFNTQGTPISKDKVHPIKAELVRHLIAFANVARVRSKPCYMVFGIENMTNTLCTDLINQYVHREKPEKWDDPDIPLHNKQEDYIHNAYQDIIDEYIDPKPDVKLEFGYFQDTFLSYLVISPNINQPRHYRLKKKLHTLNTGDVFFRYGSSSITLNPEDANSLMSASVHAYIAPAKWREYLHNFTSGDFDLGFQLGTFQVKTTSGDNAEQKILTGIGDDKKNIALIGTAGQGKTTLLQKIAYQLALKHDLTLPEFNNEFGQQDDAHETTRLFNIIKGISEKLPFYMDLRQTFFTINQFDQLICSKLNEYLDWDIVKKSSQIFSIPNTKWVILLDGVDEIRNRKTAGKILDSWIKNLPNNVQLVIASRPYAINQNSGDLNINLASLTKEEIKAVLQTKFNENNATLMMIEEFLNHQPDMYAVLDNMRAINGLVETTTSAPKQSPKIDREVVVVSINSPEEFHKNENTNQSSDNKLPIIVADLLSRDETPIESVDSEEYLGQETFSPASIIKGILEHLRILEIKRQQEYGNDPSDLAEKAFYEARRIAWESDWDTGEFNSEDVRAKKRLLDWNSFIGFIQRNEFPKYKFYSEIADHYLAADYLYVISNKKFTKIIKKIEKTTAVSKQRVIDFYNQLCDLNGQQAKLIKEEQL